MQIINQPTLRYAALSVCATVKVAKVFVAELYSFCREIAVTSSKLHTKFEWHVNSYGGVHAPLLMLFSACTRDVSYTFNTNAYSHAHINICKKVYKGYTGQFFFRFLLDCNF